MSLQISESGFEVRKSRCSVQQWINICSTIFPALLSYKIKSTRDVDYSLGEMLVVVTLYLSKNTKKKNEYQWGTVKTAFNRTEIKVQSCDRF